MQAATTQPVELRYFPTVAPPPVAVLPFRPPPGLDLDPDVIGPPPGLPLPQGLCTSKAQEVSGGGESVTYCPSTNASSSTSDSEPDMTPTCRPGIRLRVDAPAFIPAPGLASRANAKELVLATTPVAALGAPPAAPRATLRTAANIFTPCLAYVPKAEVDRAWEELAATSPETSRPRRGARGGRKVARRVQAARRYRASVAEGVQQVGDAPRP